MPHTDQLTKQAHQIAGVASQLGLAKLASIMREIERGEPVECETIVQTIQQSMQSIEHYYPEFRLFSRS